MYVRCATRSFSRNVKGNSERDLPRGGERRVSTSLAGKYRQTSSRKREKEERKREKKPH